MDDVKNVSALFVRPQTLNVNVTGPGTVTSTDGLINCPGDCRHTYAPNASVTLIAVPDGDKAFLGWGGACYGTATPTCTITMNANKDVTANFKQEQHKQEQHTLTVNVVGEGNVTSYPPGINCNGPRKCRYDFAHGTKVELTATLERDWGFVGWTGEGIDCPETGNRVVNMDAARTVQATFAPQYHILHVSIIGIPDSGRVTSNDGQIDCPGDCHGVYAHGTKVELTATPTSEWPFTRWYGAWACYGTTANCTVYFDQHVQHVKRIGVQAKFLHPGTNRIFFI